MDLSLKLKNLKIENPSKLYREMWYSTSDQKSNDTCKSYSAWQLAQETNYLIQLYMH